MQDQCDVCERPLLGDPDDDPHPPVGPRCGDCVRSRGSEPDLREENPALLDEWW